MGLPSSADSDFSALVDSTRRAALNSAKTTWAMNELDHMLKGMFRVLEVFNFLDWSLGVLAKKIEVPESISPDDLMCVLSCMDKSVRDGASEIASLYGAGIVKKRSVYCSFLTKSVSHAQRSSLLFAPLSTQLFPKHRVQDISRSLSAKATQDLLAQSARKPRPSFPTKAKKEKASVREPFRGASSSRTSTFRGRRPSRRGKTFAKSVKAPK